MDDLRNKVISTREAQRQLEFLSWRQDVNQWKAEKKRRKFYTELLLQSYEQYHGRTPEEILVERCTQSETIEMLQLVKGILSEKQFDILWLYAVDGVNQDDIGVKYGISQSAVKQRLDTIYKKIQNNLIFQQKKKVYYEGLLPSPSKLEADTPKHKIAYPSEYLMSVNAGGYFRKTKDGTKRYTSKVTCRVPEYLGQKYNGEKTWCTMCFDDFRNNKCTRLGAEE